MAIRYKNNTKLKTTEGKRYFINSVYPDIPYGESDTYLITSVGERYDILAQQFYGNSNLWWVIAVANDSKKDGLVVEPGIQLRIPADIDKIVQNYETLNANR
jgi:hypothetical protein|tara:strand:+ start:546 stop:851 length:306 start_codon:yes stop_codon:yes gene_type:complete